MTSSSTSVDSPVNQIAQLLMEVPEKETPSTEESTNEVALETTEESSQSLETDAPETEATDENPVEASDKLSDVDEEVVDTLNNLAEELDVPVSDLYQLNVKLSEGEPMTLGGLKDFYEANRSIETERETIKTREVELQQEVEQLRSAPTVSNELLQARAQVLSIQDQYNRTDWDTLRANNPGEFSALQQDFRNHFDLAKQAEDAATVKASDHQSQSRQFQQERLYEAIPQLKDDEYRLNVEATVNTFAGKYGFTAKDVANIEDSRLIRLLIDASAITTAQDSVKQKMADKSPLSTKPSAARPTVSNRKATLKRLTERAKSTGDTRDKVAAVSALLG